MDWFSGWFNGWFSNPPTTVVFLASPAEGDVILQIGRLSKGPLLRVSSKVLHKNLRLFSSYNLKQTTATGALVLPGTSDEDYQAWFILLRTLHNPGRSQGNVPINILKQVAAYADRYRCAGEIIRNVTWVAASLKDALPQDHCRFPESRLSENRDDTSDVQNRSERHADDILSIIFDVLCIAYVFGLQNVFARASRQLMWTARGDELRRGFGFELAHVLKTRPATDFDSAFLRANIELRCTLMASLPDIFYSECHSENLEECWDCNWTTNTQRWERVLMEYGSRWWESELCSCPRLCPDLNLSSVFSGLLAEMEILCENVNWEPTWEPSRELECGELRAREPAADLGKHLAKVYANVGGLCLHCVKNGKGWIFKTSCDQHFRASFQVHAS